MIVYDEIWKFNKSKHNFVLRWWGNFAGVLGGWLIDQSDRYGDYYELIGD
jgi:hypothetical protein